MKNSRDHRNEYWRKPIILIHEKINNEIKIKVKIK